MTDLDRAWDALAAGAPPETALGGLDARALLQRAEAASVSPQPADRTTALKVAAAIGGRDAVTLARRLVRDPEAEVRRYAFNLGVAGGEDGLPVLREAIAGEDGDLVVDALGMLVHDKASTTRARSLLRAADPRVRAGAARLLGQTAGRVVVAELKPLQDDPDPSVREAAAEAIARITGAPRPPPPAEGEPALPAAREPALPVASRTAAPATPAGPPPPARERAPDADSTDALLRKLGADGTVAPEAIKGVGEAQLSAAVRSWRPGADPTLARGIARAAVALGLTSWAGTVRRFLSDPSAAVRIAALEALPALQGGPSVLGVVANLLRDRDPAVRIAAMRSVAALGQAQGRADLVRQRLAPLASDADPEVKRIREEILSDLT